MATQYKNLPGLAAQLVEQLRDSRQRLLELTADVTGEALLGPKMDIVNPVIWEIGHAAWFQERWLLRNLDHVESLRRDADQLYNSFEVHHDTRWDLRLPSKMETLAYMQEVLDRSIRRLGIRDLSPEEAYFYHLAIYHEDMHGEAITYTRQTLGYPSPRLSDVLTDATPPPINPQFELADVEVPGGTFLLGAGRDEAPFVFDNEKWAHPVEVAPFRIANTPVTNEQFRKFADDGGYQRREFWSDEGWEWRQRVSAEHPVYWQRGLGGEWCRRAYDRVIPLEPYHPIIHVNWYEAQAYCLWAGRRLPTEAEWEATASLESAFTSQGIAARKRIFPWGDEPPSSDRANLDSVAMGCIDVRALAGGDSPSGCRQMIGNVWEWTGSTFGPYPGFARDPYEEYSEPWFGNYMVLRGGCWATRPRLIRNTWRNFYMPDRRDVLAGFRTCAP